MFVSLAMDSLEEDAMKFKLSAFIMIQRNVSDVLMDTS